MGNVENSFLLCFFFLQTSIYLFWNQECFISGSFYFRVCVSEYMYIYVWMDAYKTFCFRGILEMKV